MKNQYEIQKYEPRNSSPATYVRYPDNEQAKEVHLRDYLKVIMRRKSIVLIFFISVVITASVLTLMMTPLYKSTALIMIDKLDHVPVVGSNIDRDPSYYSTQYEILKSETLSERVIKKLNLDKNRDFLPTESTPSKIVKAITYPVNSALSFLSEILGPSTLEKQAPGVKNTYVEKDIPLYMIKSLTSRLEVLPVKNSQLVAVSFVSQKPDISLAVTNAVAESYIDYDLESRIAATRQARDFLANQINIAKAKLEDSENKLNDFASKNKIIFFSNEQGVNIREFSDITAALSAATTERTQKESLLKQLQESGTDNPVILNNPLIQELKKQQATLESEYSNLSKTFTADYPKMQSLGRQIDSIAKKIEREKSNVLKSLESDYKAVLKKEAYFKRAFQAQQTNVLDFQQKAAEYRSIKSEVDANKSLNDSLLQKLNELGVAAMSKSTSIQIVDPARYPMSPFKPNRMQNIMLSIIFGLIGGIGLAFSVEYFDNTIKNIDDIEQKVKLPTLGMIPLQKQQDNSPAMMITQSKEVNAFTEAFRSIGVLLLSSSANPPKTILVTSPTEKEGKTTVSISTAIALAESVGNGIIIDADLRKPKLHHNFELDNSTGLSTFLSGDVSFDGIDGRLIKPTTIKGLSIMTAGPIPSNPSELLFSSRIKDLIESLGAMFNFIIFDSVPLMGMPDSVYLSKIVDGTILVVRGGNTSKDALRESTKIFDSINARILGVVLNGAREKDLRYGGYSYYSSYFKAQ